MSAFQVLINAVRARIIGGLIAALPVALTFFIVHWLYVTLSQVVLMPVIEAVKFVLGNRGLSDTFWYTYLSPVIAVLLILFLLYALGVFVQLRLLQAVDWVMLRVPVVNTIFKALNNVVQSLGQQLQGDHRFERIVLVEFPHPGTRSLAFVTNALRDATTDRTILCVCVLTGVMPPAGFTLFVPEEQVIDIDWSMNQALQAILSGGINSPAAIHYFRGVSVPRSGPIVDAEGHPIAGQTLAHKPRDHPSGRHDAHS
jgi:uncharacterized membrane protein